MKQYWRNLLVVPNKPPPPTSVQIKLNLAHPTWSQYCSDKLWQCGTNWTEKWEFTIPGSDLLLSGLGRLVCLVQLLRLLWRGGPAQVGENYIKWRNFYLFFKIQFTEIDILVCFSSIIHCSDTDCALRVQKKYAMGEEKREEFAILSAVQVKNNDEIKFLVFLCNSVLSIYQIYSLQNNQSRCLCLLHRLKLIHFLW